MISVYTVNINEYDKPVMKVPTHCLTEEHCEPELRKVGPRKLSRYYKCFGYESLPGEVSVYLDGNLTLEAKPEDVAQHLKGDIAVFKHPDRDCAYTEAIECATTGKATMSAIERQVGHLKANSYPSNNGLYDCSVIVRRKTSRMRKLAALWWDEIALFSHRDQISFPFVCWCLGVTPDIIPGNSRESSYFSWRPH